MREGWEHRTLGEVATRVIGRTPQRKRPEFWTTEVRHPFLTIADMNSRRVTIGREGVTPEAIASGQAKRVPAGSLLLSFKLSIGKVAISDRDVYPNEAIAWVRPNEDVDLEFLALALEHVHWDNLGGRAVKGKTMNKESLDAVPLLIPSSSEQLRIVDLVGSVERVEESLDDAIAVASEARGHLLEGLLSRLPDETAQQPLGELGDFIRGRRFVKDDYVEEGLGVIHYGQIHTHFGSVATKILTFIPEEMRGRMRLASPGDVVIACTSENVEDLGKATVWLGEGDVAVHDDCQIFKHRLDPRFASHLFATEDFNEQKVQYAAGTKVTRISADSLRRILVFVPDRSIQESIGQTMSDFDATIEAMVEERLRVQELRSNLLTALLSGEHEIPESYDDLLEVS